MTPNWVFPHNDALTYNVSTHFNVGVNENVLEIMAITNGVNALPVDMRVYVERAIMTGDCDELLWIRHIHPCCDVVLDPICPKRTLFIPGQYRLVILKSVNDVMTQPTAAEVAGIKIVVIEHKDDSGAIRCLLLNIPSCVL